jgi:hypothetical protein
VDVADGEADIEAALVFEGLTSMIDELEIKCLIEAVIL